MSSYSYASYESAEARAARLRRDALVVWERACVDRRELTRRRDLEVRRREGVVFEVPRPAPIPDSADADEILRRATALTAETAGLRGSLAAAVRGAAARAADAVLSLAPAAPASAQAPASPVPRQPARTSDDERDAVLSRVRGLLERGAELGVDPATLDELARAVSGAPDPGLAGFAADTLAATIDRVAAERDLVDRQSEELAQIASILAVDGPGNDSPELEAALARVAGGEPVAPEDLAALSARADDARRRADQRLSELDQTVTRRVVTEGLVQEGYVVLADAPQTLVPQGGVLLARPDQPGFAVQVTVTPQRAQFTAVKLDAAQTAAEESAFEVVVCDDLTGVERYAAGQGVTIELTRQSIVMKPPATSATTTNTAHASEDRVTTTTATTTTARKKNRDGSRGAGRARS